MYRRKAEVIIWLILFLVLASVLAYADAPLPPGTDPNQLGPEELAKAIQNNQITDWSSVWEAAIGAAINNNPAIVDKVPNPYLANAVNNKIALLDKNEVFNEVDKRAQSDPAILNDNHEIKIKWFKKSGIEDRGAKIKQYDGMYVTTAGSASTKFLITDYPKAEVWADGSLHLADKTVINGGSVDYSLDGETLIVRNGEVDISNNPSKPPKSIQLENSRITDGKRIYVATGPLLVVKTPEYIAIEGKASLFVKERMVFKMDGKADFYYGSITLRKPKAGLTKFTEMGVDPAGKNVELRTYSVSQDTDYYGELSGQDMKDLFAKKYCEKRSCIAVSSIGNTRIAARGNNKITFNYMQGLMPSLKVETITDNSKVNFYDNRETSTGIETTAFFFSKNPVKYKGKISDVRTNIINSWNDAKGVERTYILTAGNIVPGTQTPGFKIEMRNGKTKVVGDATSDKYALITAETRAKLMRVEQFPEKVKAIFFVNTDFPGTDSDFPIFERDKDGKPIKTIDGMYVYYMDSDDKKYKENPQYTPFPPPDIQMKQMLMEMGVPEKNIIIKLNTGKEEYMKSLGSFSGSIKDGDTPFIFSSSHGMDDQTEGANVYGFMTTDKSSPFDEEVVYPSEFASATKNLNPHYPIHFTDQCFGGGFNNAIRERGSTAYTMQAASYDQTGPTSEYFSGSPYLGVMYSPEDFVNDMVNMPEVKKMVAGDRSMQKSIQAVKDYYKEAMEDGYLSFFERRIIADSAYPIINKIESKIAKEKASTRRRVDAESTGQYGTVSLNLVRGYYLERK